MFAQAQVCQWHHTVQEGCCRCMEHQHSQRLVRGSDQHQTLGTCVMTNEQSSWPSVSMLWTLEGSMRLGTSMLLAFEHRSGLGRRPSQAATMGAQE